MDGLGIWALGPVGVKAIRTYTCSVMTETINILHITVVILLKKSEHVIFLEE